MARLRVPCGSTALLSVLTFLLTLLLPLPAAASQPCYGSCIPDPPPPPAPDPACNSTAIPALEPTVVISGTVRDAKGGGIQGVCVYWSSGSNYGTAKTSSTGHYAITVLASRPVTLTANHDLYQFESRTFDPLVPTNWTQNFQLYYLLATSVTPSAFNNSPPKTLSFVVDSTAPQVGTRMIIQLPTGSTLDLLFDITYSDPNGWRRWTGDWTVPAGTADGLYTYKACGLDALATGSCDAPGGDRLSQVKGKGFAVDRLAPSITSTSPAKFSNVLALSSIAVSWQDLTSGVDATGFHMSVDGTTLSTTAAGGTVTGSAGNLSPGIHMVTVTARDFAGNVANEAFVFTLVSLTQASTTATLRQATVPVNPGAAIPPPSTVRFLAPDVDISSFTEELSASTWVGYGQIDRGFSLGSVDVVFNNETGVPQVVNVSVGSSVFSHKLAVLAPSSQPLRTTIPATETEIGDIVVSVPVGYNTPGSTATLQPRVVPLDSTSPGSGQFLSGVFAGPVTVSGHISACIQRHPAGHYLACEQSSILRVDAFTLGEIRVARAAGVQALPDSGVEVQPPGCTGCGNGPQTPPDMAQSRLVLGCALYTFQPGGVSRNLCDLSTTAGPGYFRSYVNGWVFTDPNASDSLGNSATGYPFWQQNHAETAHDSCPNGAQGSGVTASVSRGATSALAFDGAAEPRVAGSWNGPLPFYVRLGSATGPTESSSSQQPTYDTVQRSYQLTNSFNITPKPSGYRILRGSTIDEFGNSVTNPAAVANAWEGPGTSSVQLVTGADYRPTTAGGFAFVGTFAFQFTAVFDCG